MSYASGSNSGSNELYKVIYGPDNPNFFLIEGIFALFIEKNLMIIVESLTVHVEYVVNVGIVQV